MVAASAVSPELSITMGQRRPRLVLDPWLCLDAAGPALISRLQSTAELWIVRELWHILDNSHFYGLHPEALLSGRGRYHRRDDYRLLLSGLGEEGDEGGELAEEGGGDEALEDPETETGLAAVADPALLAPTARSVRQALGLWDRIRLSSDLLGLRMFWLGDGLAESLLPEGSAPSLHAVHEQLVASLDSYLAPATPLACGQRDAVALALALGGAPVLSLMEADGAAPAVCARLFGGEVQSRPVPPDDPVMALERAAWHALLVRANCAPLLWNGLRLALVHVHAPAVLPASAGPRIDEGRGADDEERPPTLDPRVWGQTRAYWYSL